MRNIFKRKAKVVEPTLVKLVRYSKGAWLKCNPGSNMQEWRDTQLPCSLSQYIIGNLSAIAKGGQVNIDKVDSVQIVTLDEEYFKYLEDSNRKDTPEVRGTYFIENKKAEELLKKNGLDKDLCLMALGMGCVLEKGKRVLSLSKESIEFLGKCLSEVYDKVWFPGYLMTADGINEAYDQLLDMGDTYLESGQKVVLGKCKEVPVDEVDMPTVFFLFIPFVVNGPVTMANVSIPEMTAALEKLQEHSFDFKENGAEAMLEKDFDSSCVNMYPFALFEDQIPQFISEAIRNMVKKHGNNVVMGERCE